MLKLVALFSHATLSNLSAVSILLQVTLLLKHTPATTDILNMVTKKTDEVR